MPSRIITPKIVVTKLWPRESTAVRQRAISAIPAPAATLRGIYNQLEDTLAQLTATQVHLGCSWRGMPPLDGTDWPDVERCWFHPTNHPGVQLTFRRVGFLDWFHFLCDVNEHWAFNLAAIGESLKYLSAIDDLLLGSAGSIWRPFAVTLNPLYESSPRPRHERSPLEDLFTNPNFVNGEGGPWNGDPDSPFTHTHAHYNFPRGASNGDAAWESIRATYERLNRKYGAEGVSGGIGDGPFNVNFEFNRGSAASGPRPHPSPADPKPQPSPTYNPPPAIATEARWLADQTGRPLKDIATNAKAARDACRACMRKFHPDVPGGDAEKFRLTKKYEEAVMRFHGRTT